MKTIKFFTFFTFFILLAWSQLVSASSYIEMLKELDIRILCLLLKVAPFVALILVSIGGILLIISDTPWKRDHAKSMIYNTLFGLVLVFIFILIAGFLGNLDLTRCLGDAGKPPEKPIIEPEVTTTTATTTTIQCTEFFDDCGGCIDNGCAWCIDSGGCYSKEECGGRCEFEYDGQTFFGRCTQREVFCPSETPEAPPGGTGEEGGDRIITGSGDTIYGGEGG